LGAPRKDIASQYCVCFTETPLEFTYLTFEDIENRSCDFQPYGIAITKKVARQKGINPIWYLDITTGHDWIAKNFDALVERYFDLKNNCFKDSDLEKIFPFIEHMGTGKDYKKEFWWEREWRYNGNFELPDKIIGLCPEDEIQEFQSLKKEIEVKFIDPKWNLEQIIANLAGFEKDKIEI